MIENKIKIIVSAAAALLFLSACAPKEAMLNNDVLVAQGHYGKAAVASEKEIDRSDRTQRNNLLWYLNAGLAYRFDHNNSASIKAFDESEWLIKHFQEQLLNADISQGTASLFVNDTTAPYRGTQYDGVMANTYKAIDYLAMEDNEGARVEFNRAVDRQRRAKAYYAKLIEKNREAIEEQQRNDNKGVDVDSSMPRAKQVLNEKYPSLYSFEAYPDFINPMVSYLAGIFALSEGDNQKAFTLLKEAYGMNRENAYIREDLAYVDALLDGSALRREPLVWVIIEDGLAPVKTEWRLDVPVWIFSNNLNYVSLALPRMQTRMRAFESYSIALEDEVFPSKLLSDMDRVVMTEFKEEYPAILRRALFSAMTKAFIQYQTQRQMQNSEGNAQALWALASIATTAYTIGSAQADTRSWRSLPKRFDLIRLHQPESRKFNIKTSSGLILTQVELPSRMPTLVYVKMTTAGAKPSVSIIPLGRK
ncbi:hypothetical protein [Sulfurimonas sp. HSL3-7]|uniref:COG3014 family protein n=1 Tax=Sulfonitrofixus jiaomeiensis TaxID=3131938 RepID=UPI0031F90DF5